MTISSSSLVSGVRLLWASAPPVNSTDPAQS
jgi:hypothetical protein